MLKKKREEKVTLEQILILSAQLTFLSFQQVKSSLKFSKSNSKCLKLSKLRLSFIHQRKAMQTNSQLNLISYGPKNPGDSLKHLHVGRCRAAAKLRSGKKNNFFI